MWLLCVTATASGWAMSATDRRQSTLSPASYVPPLSLLPPGTQIVNLLPCHAPNRCTAVRFRMVEQDNAAARKHSLTVVLSQEEDIRAALLQTAGAIALACFFCAGVFVSRGVNDASAWLAAYVLEESLSIDNLFVFSLIFDYFQTPVCAQPRVLKWGLIAAVALRLAFICAGLAVVEQFKGILLVFSGILLYSAYALLSDEDDDPEDLSQNPIIKLTKQYLPSTDQYDGDRFFTTRETPNGYISVATPLLLALVCVELSDVIFAVDSIPAVFGVTTDPFIAFSSNAFALLGLRSLYVIISTAADEYVYLQPAIAVVLGFIGVKLIGEFAGIDVPTIASLLFVLTVLGTGIGASILETVAEEKRDTEL